MRDPLSWSFAIGRVFGITVRVHVLLIIVLLGLYLRVATNDDFLPGSHVDMLALLGILFLSVLLHEFGHCYGARIVDGEANEVLLWPLGGLAFCDLPHTAKANFVCTVMGPVVNVLLCLASGIALASFSFAPPINPFWYPFTAELYNFADGHTYVNAKWPEFGSHYLLWWQVLLARVFFLNWFLFLLNVLILAYPLDGGRLLQTALWPRMGYRRATLTSVVVGFVFMFIIGIFAIAANEMLAFGLAIFIFVSCRQEWIRLETGGEESVFGYDFSQGYTSLERDDDEPPPRRKRPNFWQRWMQRRTAKRIAREQEKQAAEESRMDELLDKIAREGKESLTDEENRFLKRVADRYKHRS